MSENKNNNNNEVEELDVNHLMQIRRDKLKELQEEGKDPFEITKFNRTNSAGEIKANYEQDNLINALKDISKRYLKNDDLYPKFKYDSPFAVGIIRPRTAYHAPLKVVDLDDALGLISKESIMIYPPGIPLIIPGEIFNEDVIARIKYYKSKNATVLSDYPDKVSVIDFKTWDLYDKHKKDLEEYYESIKRHE